MNKQIVTLHVTTVDLTAWCFLRTWFTKLKDNNFDVTLACSVQRFRNDLELSGANVIDLFISRKIDFKSDFRSFCDLVSLIRKLKPDVVHTHTSKAGFIGRIAARLCKVPLVLHTIHELPENSTNNNLVKAFYWGLEYFAGLFAHHMVTVSTPNYNQILHEKICSPSKLTLIREGLDISKYKAARPKEEVRSQLQIPRDATVIGSVGRLEKAKGHHDLLEAFAKVNSKYPNTVLVITGQGHLLDSLLHKADTLGIKNKVIFTGWYDDLLSLVNSFDIFALASHYEGLGIATMEAMAMGKPVVCTAVGGVLDVVKPDYNGFLVPASDPLAMANCIMRLLDNPKLAEEFGLNGRKRVEEQFLDSVTNEKMLALYKQLLHKVNPQRYNF